ncbi:MAG: hypothetical protein GYB66_07385 [Chloroflexi bacterium]|nr:hypothetical protein [Chloroflexota bacterium]
MPKVEISQRRIRVGAESRNLISGEIHYWRLDAGVWSRVLDRASEMGLDIVSTYVCWDFHEVAPGKLDFTGETDPRRNLIRFLELAKDRGFWVLLRPGPYIYAEWVNQGVPDRVAHLHRLHPEFLAAAEAYMAAVVAVIKPYLASNGGPIVLFQADNEPEPWPRFYANQLGLENTPGPFQRFLQDRYQGDIQALNACWESNYTDFEQCRAVTSPAILRRRYLNPYLDYRRFVYWYSSEIGRWAARTYRALGVDVPIYLNFYPMMSLQNWRDIEAAGDGMAGPDYYTQNAFRRDSWEHQEYLHLLRYTRTFSRLPSIPEFQAGSWHGWHYHSGVLTPGHYPMAAISALMAGIAGWNWYMLVNRDNWYMAPINEWGRTRPELFGVFQRLVSLYRTIDPPALEKLTETAIAFDILDRSSEIGGFSDPVLTAVYQAGLDYECFDLATGQLPKPLVLYAGSEQMSRDNQSRLRQYVMEGGCLVLFDRLPVEDDAFTPLNLLDIKAPDRVLAGGSLELFLGDESLAVDPGWFFDYHTVPGEPILAERRQSNDYQAEEGMIQFHLQIGQRYTIGYRQSVGDGQVIVLGMPPSPESILALHHWLDVPIYCHARGTMIQTTLFQRDETFFLLVVNNSEVDQDACITVHSVLFQHTAYRVEDLWNGQITTLDIQTTGIVPVHVSAKQGSVLQLKPI